MQNVSPNTHIYRVGLSQSLQSILMEYGLSLPGPVSPHLAGMMVGSALVTSAHGSSLVGPATIGPFLATAVMVDGTGEVHVLSEPGDLLEGSVGMLGLVTEVTLFVQPARKVAVRQLQGEDFGMVSDMRDIIDNSAAISLDVMWSPTAGMYTARVWHGTLLHNAVHGSHGTCCADNRHHMSAYSLALWRVHANH